MKERHAQRPDKIRNLVAGACIVFAAICALGILRESMEGRKTHRQYESLAWMADKGKAPQKTSSGELNPQSPIDFDKLSKINPDIAGWLRIPGTRIDYPIVQGRDNVAYVHKSFSGETADAGCIFLDFESQRNMRGYNSILYGHNMKNGTMFRDLVRYKDEDYFKEHQYFELYTPEETIHLKAVSCYYIQGNPEVRRTNFHDEEEFQAFVRRMLEPCPYAEMPQEPVGNLYTLVTCSYELEDGRTLLFAVEADGEEVEENRNKQEKGAEGV